jgi:hypothetical protein
VVTSDLHGPALRNAATRVVPSNIADQAGGSGEEDNGLSHQLRVGSMAMKVSRTHPPVRNEKDDGSKRKSRIDELTDGSGAAIGRSWRSRPREGMP